jgi:hypothetical protein
MQMLKDTFFPSKNACSTRKRIKSPHRARSPLGKVLICKQKYVDVHRFTHHKHRTAANALKSTDTRWFTFIFILTINWLEATRQQDCTGMIGLYGLQARIYQE